MLVFAFAVLTASAPAVATTAGCLDDASQHIDQRNGNNAEHHNRLYDR